MLTLMKWMDGDIVIKLTVDTYNQTIQNIRSVHCTNSRQKTAVMSGENSAIHIQLAILRDKEGGGGGEKWNIHPCNGLSEMCG